MADPRIDRCNSCRAEIIWLKTPAGKNNPVNAATVLPEDTVFNWERHVSHFATCPDAGAWRRKK